MISVRLLNEPTPRIPGGDRSNAPRVESTRASADSPQRGRVQRNRYRVDQAYQNYRHDSSVAKTLTQLRSSATPRSAELLGSMIHQMGGATMSSAKGVFVDIAI